MSLIDNAVAGLERIVNTMRRLGIVHYKDSSIELTLGPAPVETQTEVVDKGEESANVKPKLGKDDLTAEQQRELYGVVYDAEE